MKEMNLKEIGTRVEKELEKEYQELEIFASEHGKELQISMIELGKFIVATNSSVYLGRVGFSLLDKLVDQKTMKEKIGEIVEQFLEKKNLASEQKDFFSELIMEFMNDNKDKSINDFMKGNPFYDPEFKSLERYYAHFFVSLYTYIDLYTMKLYRRINQELTDKDYFELHKRFNAQENPKKRLNTIVRYFKLYKKEVLDKDVLVGKTWETTFDKILEIRDTISHRNPLLSEENLSNSFPELLTKAKKKLKHDFEKADNQYEWFLEFFNQILPGLAISVLFIDILKECYGYLALIDNIIFEAISMS